jgi:hypothetical protein
MLAFESLGDNCEFGLIQRHGGAEPLGLLRFAGIHVPIEIRLGKLVSALERRFDGIGRPGTISVNLEGEAGQREFLVRETLYDLMYHSAVLEGAIQPQDLLKRESKRLNFLRRKLVEDLESGSKIWVWKSQSTLTADQVEPLLQVLRSMGPNILLWVVEGDALHKGGSIEQIDRDFIKGRIERFAPYGNALDVLPASWFEMCEATLRFCRPREVANGHLRGVGHAL